MSDIGKVIRIVRQAKGMTAAELAKAAEISAPFESLIESGEREPSLSVLRRIAGALSVPSDVLLIMATPQESLQTSDKRALRIANAIKTLISAEDELKKKL